MGEGRTGPYERRLTVARAADALGISAEAVRGRIRRKTLRTEKDSGTVYVLLDRTDGDRTRPTGDQPTDRTAHPDALVLQMQARIDSLERQVEEANTRDREQRRIIAGLTQRIPAIEAPQEHAEEPEGAEPRSATGGAQEAAGEAGPERRSWWRRVFGR